MTDSFDPNNETHQRIKAEIELGNGLPDVRLTTKCLEALKLAGFEVSSYFIFNGYKSMYYHFTL